jgi:hypothetical protein
VRYACSSRHVGHHRPGYRSVRDRRQRNPHLSRAHAARRPHGHLPMSINFTRSPGITRGPERSCEPQVDPRNPRSPARGMLSQFVPAVRKPVTWTGRARNKGPGGARP